MGDVTAVNMDVITEKSGHNMVPNAVSVCITPAAPSPLPMPYPVTASIGEGSTDAAMRTKINGANVVTVGSVFKACHGNEPGTLKEVVSLNTGGPCFLIMGAPIVLIELGMAGITGSPGMMNKAITVGAGGSASGASGDASGGGAGSSGSGAGTNQKGKDPSNPAGGDGNGDGSGASADAAAGDKQDEYCPDKDKRAAPGPDGNAVAHIDDMDLRNHRAAVDAHANAQGKEAAHAAMDEAPGGASGGKKQAFWSGSGKDAAKRDGGTIQEDAGGAAHLEQMGNAGQLPDWNKDDKAGAGSNVTNERLWKTISMRSAENASGSVDAHVVGTAWPGNVFSSVELPTLLHNPNLQEINFKDPNGGPPAPVVQSWKKNAKGCWQGGAVPSVPQSPSARNPAGNPCPGFKLHPTSGFVRT